MMLGQITARIYLLKSVIVKCVNPKSLEENFTFKAFVPISVVCNLYLKQNM